MLMHNKPILDVKAKMLMWIPGVRFEEKANATGEIRTNNCTNAVSMQYCEYWLADCV